MEYYVRTQYSPWHRFRVQAAGGILAALLPYLTRLAMVWGDPKLIGGPSDSVAVLHFTFFFSIISILTGTIIIRSIARYPGVEGSASILPTFSATFGFMLFILVMGRFEYNRFVLAGSYILAALWFYFIYFKEQHRPLRIGMLPQAPLDPAWSQIKRVVLVPLPHPDSIGEHIDAIAVDLRIDLPPQWERCLADHALAGMPVFHVKHLLESLTGRIALEHLSETSYGTLSPSPFYLTVKQICDRIMAAIAAVGLSPVLVAIVVAIKLDSAGPAIFKQRRIGYRGEPFTVYKFRTMNDASPGGEQRVAAMTRNDDVRITRIGSFLRKSRLDELAQIFNILRGEMSWIGPRPEAEVLSRWYENDIPFYRYRHIVLPGITGWAQVNQGHVAELEDVTNKLHYDFYYIKNFSPWMDILIVVRTIWTMLTGFGAK